MPRFNLIKNSFLAGEVSPKMEGRTDLPQYPHACRELLNMIPLKQGGTTKRPGSEYVLSSSLQGPDWIDDPDGSIERPLSPLYAESVRLIEFVFSKKEAYVVEISPNQIRVIGASSKEVEAVISLIPPFRPPNVEPYLLQELNEIRHAQINDVLYLTHKNHRQYKLTRRRSDLGKYGFEFELRPAMDVSVFGSTAEAIYYPWEKGILGNAIFLSGKTGNVNVLSTSAAIFSEASIGELMKIHYRVEKSGPKYHQTVALIKITEYVSPTEVKATVLKDALDNVNFWFYEVPAWSNTRGWPSIVAFYDLALYYGATHSQPSTLWRSALGNFDTFMKTPLWTDEELTQDEAEFFKYQGKVGDATAKEPLEIPLASAELNELKWFSPGKTLLIGTSGAEYPAQIEAELMSFRPESAYGSAPVQPRRIGSTACFVQRNGRTVRELFFDRDQESYVSEDISFMADHLPGEEIGMPSEIIQSAYQSDMDILWLLDNSGGLFSIVRDKQAGVAAWSKYRIGGGHDGFSARVRSIVSIPSATSGCDELWMSVERKFGDEYFYHLEVIRVNSDAVSDPVYLDSCMKLEVEDGVASGLHHLAGVEVSVLGLSGFIGRAYNLGTQTVQEDGTITVPENTPKVIVGLPYKARIKTMRLEAGSAVGSSYGSNMRVDRAAIRFYKTIGAKFGPSENSLESIPFKRSNDPMNLPIDPFSGDKVVNFPGGYEIDPCVVIEQDLPYPMSVTYISARGVTYDS